MIVNIIKIEDIEELMYQSFKKEIANFAKSKNNKNIYAFVFDCDLGNFNLCLRYANERDYKNRLADYDKYAYMCQPYGKKGLFGYKYSVGDFGRIDWKVEGEIMHFFNSGYCQVVDAVYYGNAIRPADTFEYNGEFLKGDTQTELLHCYDGAFYKDGVFFVGLGDKLMNILEEIIVNCILRLKNDDLGLDQTDDFIMFMCDHDISNATLAEYVKRTVDKDIFEQLTDYSSLEEIQ
ncbi:MAG: hypothetical protein K2N27_00645 [Ruminococcus sp.]|nr:hypothetical protein [Ruminococcus sp.]